MTLLNSEGALPKHAEQFDALIAKKVDAIIIAMGKPVEADAQFKAAKDAKIPVITVQSGASPHALFDIQSNEYKIGADAALYLLGQLGYQGNILTARFDLNVASRIRGKVLDIVLSENHSGEGCRQVLDGPHPAGATTCAPACRRCCCRTRARSTASGLRSTARPTSSTTCCRPKA